MKRILLKGFKRDKQSRGSHLRIKHNSGVAAQIDTEFDNESFKPTVPALVFDESFHGCGIIVMSDCNLKQGDLCKIQISDLAPLEAEVAWKKEVDEHIFKIGLKFLE